MTTRTELSAWFDAGVHDEFDYMFVVCDTFSYEDYAVYAVTDDFQRTLTEYNGRNMQRVMEIYDLRQDKAEQINAVRVWHVPPSPNSQKE